MADLSITEANVGIASLDTTELVTERITIGATIGKGVAVYRDLTASRKLIAAAPAATVSALVTGITLFGGVDAGIGLMATKGPVVIGATLVAGETYYLSSTAGGKIGLLADITVGHYVIKIGLALSTTILDIYIEQLGVSTAGTTVKA